MELVAHEMAHMWFGDLVTMEWWDDLWLNEAFATWVSFKVGREVHPEMNFELMSYKSISSARANDTQPSVKPIRRPFKGSDNLNEAFDTLSYEKGQAVLSMIEGWIGEAKFQEALRNYFNKHAWGNTRAEDLWAAFAEAGDKSLQETLRRYLEQPGVPELSFKRIGGNRIEVSQRRYRTMTATGISEQVWQVPIVMRFGNGSGEQTVRLLLKRESDSFEVPGIDQAEWIYPNSGDSGYYLWNLPPELTSTLIKNARAKLSTIERLGLLGTADNAMMAGNLGADQLLELAASFGDDPQEEVLSAVAGSFAGLRNLVPTNEWPAYAKVLRRVLRPMLDRITFEPKAGETAELQNQRSLLLNALGIDGQDREVVDFCKMAAARQCEDPRSVSPSITGVTLTVATWYGDAAWWERIRTAFEKAKDPDVRARFLTRLTDARDPELVRRGLDYSLTEAVRPTEIMGCLFGRPELAAVRFEWLAANFEGVKKKIASQFLPSVVGALYGGDLELLKKGQAFFLDPERKDALTELRLTEVGDAIKLETALRERNGPALVRFTKEWAEPVVP